ncbi:multidrug resistance efflux transporter family protein [Neobacillus piezotolerans]|uniref:Multidrug resistance efflux transporter family protein n=1 Tax=Neobacillus piezotolerans TaxID=2259171 RepID=A0A3D8GNA6_9BACI|nr:multidrug resistance efflux transporter family protein [Neobacillus piezotolerans]RDU35761.1 multidrug resistance efflux transporter family protein [Neobacillus piezotolerans]
MKPIVLGIASAFFFAFTFVLNRSMELSGGHWIWSASLRYFFMVPLLLLLVAGRKNLKPLFEEMKQQPGAWLLWSTIGFGLFYAPICFAAAFSPGWLIAGTWLVTIVSGSLLSPLFFETRNGERVRGRIPVKGMLMSIIILAGVAVMQLEHAKTLGMKEFLFGVIPVLIATFAYPLGNRKMMDVAGGRLDTFQRVLGMTIASLPFWIGLSLYGAVTTDLPSKSQLFQSAGVAISSGVIATVLFFMATDIVRGDMTKMAAVEATQSIEILFALGGEVLFLATPLPSALSWAGIALVVAGMALHSFSASILPGKKKKSMVQEQA